VGGKWFKDVKHRIFVLLFLFFLSPLSFANNHHEHMPGLFRAEDFAVVLDDIQYMDDIFQRVFRAANGRAEFARFLAEHFGLSANDPALKALADKLGPNLTLREVLDVVGGSDRKKAFIELLTLGNESAEKIRSSRYYSCRPHQRAYSRVDSTLVRF
jgi:hypothetical protein